MCVRDVGVCERCGSVCGGGKQEGKGRRESGGWKGEEGKGRMERDDGKGGRRGEDGDGKGGGKGLLTFWGPLMH